MVTYANFFGYPINGGDFLAGIHGTNQGEVLYGTFYSDSIFGWGGNDSLYGGYGNDLLDGGTGRDYLDGGYGNDTYIVDSLYDRVIEHFNRGIDTVKSTVSYSLPTYVEKLVLLGSAAINGYGTQYANTITGNNAANRLYGNDGNDLISGRGGDDVLVGGNGSDTLDGGKQDDFLIGNSGNDSLIGGYGNDTLDGGGGRDTLIGGYGDDHYVLNYVLNEGYYTLDFDQIVEHEGQGRDRITINGEFSLFGDQVFISAYTDQSIEDIYLVGFAPNSRIWGNEKDNYISAKDSTGWSIKLWGNDGDDEIHGGDTGSELLGGDGNDTIYGGAGNDFISGGEGENELYGGAGDDHLIDGVENASGDSYLNGGPGRDLLNGGPGADRLIGGEDHDEYRYLRPEYSLIDAPDRILQFDAPGAAVGDRIDLTFIDVDDLRITDGQGGVTVVDIDVADGPDMRILIEDGATAASEYTVRGLPDGENRYDNLLYDQYDILV